MHKTELENIYSHIYNPVQTFGISTIFLFLYKLMLLFWKDAFKCNYALKVKVNATKKFYFK